MKFIIIILLFAFSYCQEQLPEYYVYLVKGDAQISKAGTKPIAIKQNTLVYSKNILSLKKDAEVTLVDKNGKYLEIHTPGNYNTEELELNTLKNPDGVTQKYLKLLYNELLNPQYDYTKFKKENIAGVYGGVSRGGVGTMYKNLIFPINCFKSSIVEKIPFIWHQTSVSLDYRFIIYNDEKKEVINVPVRDTQKILSGAKDLSKPGNYYWLVKSEKADCEDEVPVYFEIITKEDEQKIIISVMPKQMMI